MQHPNQKATNAKKTGNWCMASEKTAAAEGKVGETRRDPMAMIPFCGYHMADYWQHWLDMEERITNPPVICNVNWFRTDDNGKFLWPGFGDNLRVLNWILDRCDGKVDAKETAIGYVPYAKDIDLTGIEDEVPFENLEKILTVENSLWAEEVPGIEAFYAKFGDKLPATLRGELDALKANLG